MKESGENYLETILKLEQKSTNVRSVDIANELGYSKPSISKAMSVLKKAGYINQESYGSITLTQLGREKATQIYEKHKLITKFLIMTLEIDEDIAEKDACRIEHIINPLTFSKMKDFVSSKHKQK